MKMSQIPEDPKTRLSRKATAAALPAAGFRTSSETLATWASRGGGPPFQKYGRWPIYTWDSSLAWARERCSPVVTSTAALPSRDCAAANLRRGSTSGGDGRNKNGTAADEHLQMATITAVTPQGFTERKRRVRHSGSAVE